MNRRRPQEEVVDLLSSSDDDDDNMSISDRSRIVTTSTSNEARRDGSGRGSSGSSTSGEGRKRSGRKRASPSSLVWTASSSTSRAAPPLQAGIVLDEDTHDASKSAAAADTGQTNGPPTTSTRSYVNLQLDRVRRSLPPVLYHDPDFETVPVSIDGANSAAAAATAGGAAISSSSSSSAAAASSKPVLPKSSIEKCRCSPPQPAYLAYSSNSGPNLDRPHYRCAKNKCNHFKWAYTSSLIRWHRLGPHTNHTLVGPNGFRAFDLLQGKVGDCWFLSALAVVAERSDLISRLFGNMAGMNEFGIVEVRLFVDGFWKSIVMDNFLPCLIDDDEEDQLGRAIQASLGGATAVAGASSSLSSSLSSSSDHDPHALSDKNRNVIVRTNQFLEQDMFKKNGPRLSSGRRSRYSRNVPRRLDRVVTSNDLAYSKAKNDQLWVPLLEKAYSKVHGCYKAISGGHIAEAFLDLTGAPTLVYDLLDSPDFQPRSFWTKLLSYRARKLPMGCGTSNTSQAGIIGMHAYSILDVREIRNVGLDFFRDGLVSGTMGNVSGFTDFDGTVRLLRIRNPHGKGEWKGEFSDGSAVWERLLENRSSVDDHPGSPGLHRTMKNDGTFWIDYDNFLMGFSNVDVVLAFEGNHAKSFATNFPPKKSNHRCARAFEVSLLEEQPGVPATDTVELFVLGIQKNRRGAYHGRTDRKKSYKVCDLGMIVGENRNSRLDAFEDEKDAEDAEIEFDAVEGQMFGFKRNGHYRLVLDRKKSKSLVVMPISFGHPAATDKELSFVLRFVSDAPLLIRELPRAPRMDVVMQKLCLKANLVQSAVISGSSRRGEAQGSKRLLLDDLAGKKKIGEPLFRVFQVDYLGNDGGTVFVYLSINDEMIQRKGPRDFSVSFSVVVNCRGMVCRTEDGLLQHETVGKGKKFEAAWRRYTCHFKGECKSRLLMVAVQSGQDTEMGSVKCELATDKDGSTKENTSTEHNSLTEFLGISASAQKIPAHDDDYEKLGIYTGVSGHVHGGFDLSEPSNRAGEVVSLIGSNTTADSDLERALALSCGDTELQRALERSSHESRQSIPPAGGSFSSKPSANFDQDMERAIAASIKDSTSTSSTGAEGRDHNPNRPRGSFSQELEKAMALSLDESKSRASTSGVSGSSHCDKIVDLVSSPVTEIAGGNGSGSKRKKHDADDKPECALLEGGDDAFSENDAVDPTEKRRLAAEAAMKRFRSD